jgi:hypothetical protein
VKDISFARYIGLFTKGVSGRLLLLHVGYWFGTSPEFWLNLQKLYELRLAREEIGDRVERLPKLTERKRKKENDAPRLL